MPTTKSKTAAAAAMTEEKTRVDNGICDTVMDVIGETPLVRLHSTAKHLECEVLVKCEFFNAGKLNLHYVLVCTKTHHTNQT